MAAPSGPRHDHLNLPPGCKSSSHFVISQPGGPNSQRFSSSGLAIASHTSRRGALKIRVRTISRSVGVVTFKTFFNIDKSPSGFGVLVRFLLGLHLVEQ